MKKLLVASIVLVIIISGCAQQQPQAQKTPATIVQSPASDTQTQSADFKLTSPVFQDGGQIPLKYTCDGENFSPPLNITSTPKKAKELALIVEDPDAMGLAGKIWTHWILWDINPSVSEIGENSPLGVQGTTDFGTRGYRGPCPPDKEHRYLFKLYALDKEISLPEGSKKVELEKAMEGHIIQETILTGKYNRKG